MRRAKHLLSNAVRLLIPTLILIFSGQLLLAQQTVKGTVKGEDGEPLVGAAISVKGASGIGAYTDATGSFQLEVPAGAKLVIRYVGMEPQEIAADGQADITLIEDRSQLSELVITTSRQPVRKLESTTAVEVLDARQIKIRKPEAINEAIAGTPGVFANTAQGRRGGVIVRGFPDGNPLGGLVYTTMMLDGLPTLGTTGRLPDVAFGFDLNVDRVEVVRGAAATLFGRASAAGAINVITRTGGTQHAGTVRGTYYNDILGTSDFNYRADVNFNGPIAKNIRYNVGGWFLQDAGYRNTGYKDDGGQFRGNIDFLFPKGKGKFRVYGLLSNFNFQNLTDVAVDPSTLKLAPGWKNTDTYQPVRYDTLNYRVAEGNPPRRRLVPGADGQTIVRNLGEAMDEGGYVRGGHIGFEVNYDLGGGFAIENRFRYQDITSGTKYGFPLPSFYSKTTVLRLFLDGDARDRDILNELRLKKSLDLGNSSHTFSVGGYFSTINLLPTTYSYAHNSTTDPNNIRLNAVFPATAPPSPFGSITRRGDYTEQVLAGFIGDEMKIGEKLRINIGVRFDVLNIDMKETKAPFDSLMQRKESFSDWSGSIGANYLLGDRTAVYGNVIRAFRTPDYTAFTSLEKNSAAPGKFLRAPDGISGNEIVTNAELGLRTAFSDFGLDLAAFISNIDNRLASIFENGILVSKPLGANRIMGGEISLSYAPKAVKGLLLRTSFTLQDGRFTDFKIPLSTRFPAGNPKAGQLVIDVNGDLYGNKIINEGKDSRGRDNYSFDLKGNRLPGTPGTIFNAFGSYDHKYFGVDFSANVNGGGRYSDATNTIDLGTLTILNAGAYARIPVKGSHEFRIGVQAKNLANATALQSIAGLAENDTAIAQRYDPNGFTNVYAQGYVQLPRRILATLTYSF